MNTEFLKEFLILADSKNYWNAAEQLFMNQSTLSKHIHALEEKLGVTLFRRTTRRVQLTPYGEALYPYAQNILRLEYEYQSLLAQMRNAELGSLTLGTIPTMAQYGITELMRGFYKKYPNAKIQTIEADPNQLKETLLSGKCELIFQRETRASFEQQFMKDDTIIRIPYIQDHMVAILPKTHPLATKKELNLRELREENFCFIKEESLMYELCIDACHTAGFIPQIILATHRIDNILDMVANDNCVALLMNYHIDPAKSFSASRDRAYAVVAITPLIKTQISLCYLANRPLSPTAQKFVSYVEEYRL